MSSTWDRRSTIVIGIGSPHGDDQFGWAVVDNLASMNRFDVKLLKISNPLDIIHELENYERVILVDACDELPQSTGVLMLNYAEATVKELVREIPQRSTHDFGVDMSLRLAESLGKTTDHVTLWIGQGETFDKIAEMGSTTAAAAVDCAHAIAEVLRDARNVTC